MAGFAPDALVLKSAAAASEQSMAKNEDDPQEPPSGCTANRELRPERSGAWIFDAYCCPARLLFYNITIKVVS
jgi:hypothetical protein